MLCEGSNPLILVWSHTIGDGGLLANVSDIDNYNISGSQLVKAHNLLPP